MDARTSDAKPTRMSLPIEAPLKRLMKMEAVSEDRTIGDQINLILRERYIEQGKLAR